MPSFHSLPLPCKYDISRHELFDRLLLGCICFFISLKSRGFLFSYIYYRICQLHVNEFRLSLMISHWHYILFRKAQVSLAILHSTTATAGSHCFQAHAFHFTGQISAGLSLHTSSFVPTFISLFSLFIFLFDAFSNIRPGLLRTFSHFASIFLFELEMRAAFCRWWETAYYSDADLFASPRHWQPQAKFAWLIYNFYNACKLALDFSRAFQTSFISEAKWVQFCIKCTGLPLLWL